MHELKWFVFGAACNYMRVVTLDRLLNHSDRKLMLRKGNSLIEALKQVTFDKQVEPLHSILRLLMNELREMQRKERQFKIHL